MNGMLWKIVDPKRDDVAGEWRGVHHKEFYDLCSSQNLI